MSRSRPGIRRAAVDRVWNVYPDPRVIHLGDRALTVEDAGPDRGFPVLVHCGGGSRHLSPAAVREARLHGFRLISYDRPGYGGSTPMPDRVIADCCADVEAILGGLGISRIAVWGFSGGGPYALATAALLPNAVTAVCLFAPLGPYGAAGLDFLDGMADSYREEVRIFFSDRAAAREKFRAEAAEMFGRLSTPGGWLAQWGDRAGKDAAHGQEAADYLASIYQDGWTHGDDGWWDDWSAFLGPWGFDLAAITAPVSLWHGLADTRCPPGHSRWLAERIPRMTTHFPETEDHTNIEDNNRTAAYEWLRGLLTDQALPLAQERNRHLRSRTTGTPRAYGDTTTREHSCQVCGSAAGHREPDPDPDGTGNEDDRSYAGLGQAYHGIDIGVPGSVCAEVVRADVGNRGRAVGTYALAADDGTEIRERVRASQRGRNGRLVGEDQPLHLHQQVTVALKRAVPGCEHPWKPPAWYAPDRVRRTHVRAGNRRHRVELQHRRGARASRGGDALHRRHAHQGRATDDTQQPADLAHLRTSLRGWRTGPSRHRPQAFPDDTCN